MALIYFFLSSTSCPHHRAAAGATAEPPLVHSLWRDGKPEARAAVVPRKQAPPGTRLHPHQDPQVRGQCGLRLPTAGQPYAHSQRPVQASGQE